MLPTTTPHKSINKTNTNTDHLLQIRFAIVPIIYFLITVGGLVTCLWVAYRNHWQSVCKNEFFVEFWPSISATTGDFFPEKTIWQISAALACFPKFFMTICLYYIFKSTFQIVMERKDHSNSIALQSFYFLNILLLIFGLLRWLNAGFWIYVTSSDYLWFHIQTFIVYAVFGYLEKWCIILLTRKRIQLLPQNDLSKQQVQSHLKYIKFGYFVKWICLLGYHALLVAAVYFYSQHRLQVEGAYAWYSVMEWGMAFFELSFDASLCFDLISVTISIKSPILKSIAE